MAKKLQDSKTLHFPRPGPAWIVCKAAWCELTEVSQNLSSPAVPWCTSNIHSQDGTQNQIVVSFGSVILVNLYMTGLLTIFDVDGMS